MEISTATPGVAQRDLLIDALRQHALKIEQVQLSNGSTSEYYVDVKEAVFLPHPARIIGKQVAAFAHEVGATAVGGLVQGANALASAAIMVDEGTDLAGFFVRKEEKSHGLHRLIEGPRARLAPGTHVLVVDDVVTTGASTVQAIERVLDAGLHVAGVLSVVDRLAGGEELIGQAAGGAPYRYLVNIDELYPDRPDRND